MIFFPKRVHAGVERGDCAALPVGRHGFFAQLGETVRQKVFTVAHLSHVTGERPNRFPAITFLLSPRGGPTSNRAHRVSNRVVCRGSGCRRRRGGSILLARPRRAAEPPSLVVVEQQVALGFLWWRTQRRALRKDICQHAPIRRRTPSSSLGGAGVRRGQHGAVPAGPAGRRPPTRQGGRARTRRSRQPHPRSREVDEFRGDEPASAGAPAVEHPQRAGSSPVGGFSIAATGGRPPASRSAFRGSVRTACPSGSVTPEP